MASNPDPDVDGTFEYIIPTAKDAVKGLVGIKATGVMYLRSAGFGIEFQNAAGVVLATMTEAAWPGAAGITGGGTIGKIPKFSGATAIGDSNLADNGPDVTSLVPILGPDGSAPVASFSFSSTPGTGLFVDTGALSIAAAGNPSFSFGSGPTNGRIYSHSGGGSAAAPEYSFAGADSNTGMFNLGGGILGFTSSGVEQGRFTPLGAEITGTLKCNAAGIQLGTLDPFARPQIWNDMPDAVLRLGACTTDGDPADVNSEGIVVYKCVGVDQMARVKADRFGLTRSSDSSLYYFYVNETDLYYRADPPGGAYHFYVNRASGFIGMGTNAPSEILHVVGNVKVDTVGNGLIFPDLTKQTTAFVPIPVTNTLYVDNKRVDIYTPDGSFAKPFLKIQDAIDAISAPSATNKFCIQISPGAYYSDPITIDKIYTTLQSCGLQGARISGLITVATPSLSQITFVGLRISGGLSCLVSHIAINVINCNVTTTAWVINPTTPTDDEYLQVFGGLWYADVTLTNVYAYLMGGGYYSTFAATNKEFNINNADINTPFQVTLSGTCVGSAYGDRAGGSVFILNNGVIMYMDADTEGGSLVTVNIGATLNRTTKAANITNTPAGDVAAVTVQAAINELDTEKPTISSGGAAPVSTPGKVGDIYVDTVNLKLYFAAGIASSADWIAAN